MQAEIQLPPPPPDAVALDDPRSPRHVVYRLWSGVYPAALCHTAIDTFHRDAFTPSEIQDSGGDSYVARQTRQARNVFIDPAHWVGALVTHYAAIANRVWNLDLVGLGTLSLVRYEIGDHFDWHVDVLSRDDVTYPGLGSELERKLSVTVNLTDPDDYAGGDLEFINGAGHTISEPDLRRQGSVVVFPSTVGHRVTTITSGVRHALVGWMVGPPLR